MDLLSGTGRSILRTRDHPRIRRVKIVANNVSCADGNTEKGNYENSGEQEFFHMRSQ